MVYYSCAVAVRECVTSPLCGVVYGIFPESVAAATRSTLFLRERVYNFKTHRAPDAPRVNGVRLAPAAERNRPRRKPVNG